MAEMVVVAAALVASVVLGLWLYQRFAAAGDTTVAVFGLIRNGSTFLIGAFLLMTGVWPLMILGGIVIIIAVFLGSTHAANLDQQTSLRKRISG